MGLDSILWIVLFVGILVLIELGYYMATALWSPEKRQLTPSGRPPATLTSPGNMARGSG